MTVFIIIKVVVVISVMILAISIVNIIIAIVIMDIGGRNFNRHGHCCCHRHLQCYYYRRRRRVVVIIMVVNNGIDAIVIDIIYVNVISSTILFIAIVLPGKPASDMPWPLPEFRKWGESKPPRPPPRLILGEESIETLCIFCALMMKFHDTKCCRRTAFAAVQTTNG